ncbi:MAG: hypothetical protein HPY75_08500 [Actinobacteria bacterium]|nr:hypothetical protein [Actinomycetota bacterium]
MAAVLGAVFFVVPAVTSRPARAVGGAVIAVTPTRIPLQMAPGEEWSGFVELINQGDESVELIPRVAMLKSGTEGGWSLVEDERCAWISPGKDELNLAPFAHLACPLAVNVPSDVVPAAYQFTVYFELARKEDEGVNMTGGVGVLVDLEVHAPPGPEGGKGRGTPVSLIVVTTAGAIILAAGAAFTAARIKGRKRAVSGKKAGDEGS